MTYEEADGEGVVNVPDSLFGLLPQVGHRTRSSLLWIDPPPLFLLVSFNTFQVGNVKKWKQTKLQILQESCFWKKVPMFKYLNFFGKLACENIFIFARNSKQGSKEGTTLPNALELRPIMIFDMRM